MIERGRIIIAQYKPDGNNKRYEDKMPDVVDKRSTVEVEVNDDTLFEPIQFNTKGHKKNTWVKSIIEQSAIQKPLKKCVICEKLINHDERNHYKALGLDES